jgi:hypothetical protein
MEGALTGLVKRRLTTVLTDRLREEPTIVLNGPRTVGKSTLLATLAQRLDRVVIECDDPATRSASRIRQREMLPRLLNQLAARSGQIVLPLDVLWT